MAYDLFPPYEATITTLVERITALIPTHPEILTLENCWDLFNIKDFNVDDLKPSLFQASRALYLAKQQFNGEQP